MLAQGRLKFFVDNNLSTHLAEGLKAFGENVMHLKDQYPEAAIDTDWLPWIGENGLILISLDRGQLKHADELAIIRSFRIGAFYMTGKGLSACQIIRQIVRHWPKIKEISTKTTRPFAFRIPPQGEKIERIPF